MSYDYEQALLTCYSDAERDQFSEFIDRLYEHAEKREPDSNGSQLSVLCSCWKSPTGKSISQSRTFRDSSISRLNNKTGDTSGRDGDYLFILQISLSLHNALIDE